MPDRVYVVRAHWDDEPQVWVASSVHLPGLVTEAETLELLEAKLWVLVPKLLELNGALPGGGDGPVQVPVQIRAERRDMIRLRA